MVQFQSISRDGAKFRCQNSSTAAQHAFSFKNFDAQLRNENVTGMISKPLCQRLPTECGTPRICIHGSLKMTLLVETAAAERGGQKPPPLGVQMCTAAQPAAFIRNTADHNSSFGESSCRRLCVDKPCAAHRSLQFPHAHRSRLHQASTALHHPGHGGGEQCPAPGLGGGERSWQF